MQLRPGDGAEDPEWTQSNDPTLTRHPRGYRTPLCAGPAGRAREMLISKWGGSLASNEPDQLALELLPHQVSPEGQVEQASPRGVRICVCLWRLHKGQGRMTRQEHRPHVPESRSVIGCCADMFDFTPDHLSPPSARAPSLCTLQQQADARHGHHCCLTFRVE